MKKNYLLILLILFTQVNFAQINNYENGDTVHDFTVVDVYGNSHNLYTYTAAGKHVFIDFFYSACGGCQNFMPVFNEFYDKYGCNQGDIICISMNSGYDKDVEVIAFENTYGGAFNHAPAISLDGGCESVITDFDPIYYPACVLIGPDNTMLNSDIYPLDAVSDIETAFPVDFNPQPMECTLAVNDFSDAFDFKIYPNPNNGKTLNISLNKAEKTNISIYNILGEMVFNSTTNQTKKSIPIDLISGTYLVKVQTKNAIKTQKLVVQ